MGIIDVIKDVGGPIASVVGSIASGITGSAAQKSANKTNLQIAQETNKTQMDIANKANALQQQNFERQLQYMSPSEQRRMLEEAGYSPSAYLNGGATSSSGTPPSANVPQLHNAEVQPVSALSENLGAMSANLANNVKLLAEARKADAEAAGQNLQNDVFMQQFEQNMKLLGLDEEYNSIRNSYENQRQSLSMEALQQSNLLTEQQIKDLQLTIDIRQNYKDNIQPKELQKLISEIHLLDEQSITQGNLRNYYDAAAKAGLTNAEANSLLARIEKFYSYNKNESYASQAEYNRAAAGVQSQQYVSMEMDNTIKKLYGKETAKQTLLNLIKQGDFTDSAVEKLWKENKVLQKELNWFEFKAITGSLKSIVGTAQEGVLIKALL